MKFSVMVSSQGTACSETALCSRHDNEEMRLKLEKETERFGKDRGVRWECGVENEALSCVVCGEN